jgi:hypothetical protein
MMELSFLVPSTINLIGYPTRPRWLPSVAIYSPQAMHYAKPKIDFLSKGLAGIDH